MAREVILAAMKNSEAVWTELKRDWYKLKLPGTAYTPADFVARLLIGHLNMSVEEVTEALKNVEELPFEELKAEKVLSGNFRITDDIAKIAMAVLLEVPEIAQSSPYESDVETQSSESEEVAEDHTHTTKFEVRRDEPIEDVTGCPHCGHDFFKCARGDYEETIAEREPVVMASLSKSTANSDSAVEGCCHVDVNNQCAECTTEDTVECKACEVKVIKSKAVKCKDYERCESAYCTDCAKDSLSEHNFCSECETIQCSKCDTDIDNGSQKKCQNPRCQQEDQDFCDDCASHYLNKRGDCPSCSGEEEITCNACDSEFTESLLIKCKDFEDCGNAFCADDAKDSLNEGGFCDGCGTVSCSGCNEDIENGKQQRCKNPNCSEEDQDFCDYCAADLLNRKKLCSACSGEEEIDCSECQDTYTESLLKKCKNFDQCGNAYCPDDKGSLDARRLCPQCQA